MKKITLMLVLVLATYSSFSQSWYTRTDSITGAQFDLPDTMPPYDTLDVRFYAGEVDTSLAVQVHVYDSVSFAETEDIFQDALDEENGDTLRAMARLTLVATNSTLTAIADVTTNGVDGVELGMAYNTLAADEQFHTFIRFYIYNRSLICFTITGTENDLNRFLSTKTSFFASIDFS